MYTIAAESRKTIVRRGVVNEEIDFKKDVGIAMWYIFVDCIDMPDIVSPCGNSICK